MIDAGRRAWSQLRPPGPLAGGRERLDTEYRSGIWDYLASDVELPRFGVVAGYLLRFGEGGRILELGCGEGLLAARTGPDRYGEYVGVDLSAAAIARAEARGLPRSSFVAADAAEFMPQGRFGVVVFNEVLEYLEDPVSVVRRYEGVLDEDGVFVVSQYDAPDNVRTRRIWKRLARRYPTRLEARVSVSRRLTWVIKVLEPHGTD